MVRNKNKYGIKPLLGLSTSGPTNTELTIFKPIRKVRTDCKVLNHSLYYYEAIYGHKIQISNENTNIKNHFPGYNHNTNYTQIVIISRYNTDSNLEIPNTPFGF